MKKDPKVSRSPASSKKDRYPESPDKLPIKFSSSDVANKDTFSNAPYAQQNREIAAEQLGMRNFFYNNVDPRRKQELSDSRLIQEDHSMVSNLPQKMEHHTFDPNVYPERLAMYNQSTKAKR